MKTTTRIIKSIARIPIIDAIIDKYFKGMREKFTEKVNKEIAEAYEKYGIEAIDIFDKCMNNNNFFYTNSFTHFFAIAISSFVTSSSKSQKVLFSISFPERSAYHKSPTAYLESPFLKWNVSRCTLSILIPLYFSYIVTVLHLQQT